MEEKKIGYRREFLNKPYEVSLNSVISYTVKVNSWKKEITEKGLFDSGDIDFTIADCNKRISLDFSIERDEDLQNSLYKLDKIIAVCINMKIDLEAARREIRRGQGVVI